jgi:hypothetical protein
MTHIADPSAIRLTGWPEATLLAAVFLLLFLFLNHGVRCRVLFCLEFLWLFFRLRNIRSRWLSRHDIWKESD